MSKCILNYVYGFSVELLTKKEFQTIIDSEFDDFEFMYYPAWHGTGMCGGTIALEEVGFTSSEFEENGCISATYLKNILDEHQIIPEETMNLFKEKLASLNLEKYVEHIQLYFCQNIER